MAGAGRVAPGACSLLRGRRLFHPRRKARFVAPAAPARSAARSDGFPFTLNTGRVRDQWHTMTRTGKTPRLAAHRPAPFVEVNPADAARLNLRHGDLARVSTAHGAAVLEVAVEEGQRPGRSSRRFTGAARTLRMGESARSSMRSSIRSPASPTRRRRRPRSRRSPRGRAASCCRARRSRRPPCPRACGGRGPRSAAGSARCSRRRVRHATSPNGRRPCSPARSSPNTPMTPPGSIAAPRSPAGACKACFSPARPRRGRIGTRRRRSSQRRGTARRGSCCRVRPAAATPMPARWCAPASASGSRESGTAVLTEAATSPEAIGQLLRAGTNCGSCVPEMKRIIARELAPQAG